MGFLKTMKMYKEAVELLPERVTEKKCSDYEFLIDAAKIIYKNIAHANKCQLIIDDDIINLSSAEEISKTNEAIEKIVNGTDEGWEKSFVKINKSLFPDSIKLQMYGRSEFMCDIISALRTIDILKQDGYDIMTEDNILNKMCADSRFRNEIERYAKVFDFEIVSEEVFVKYVKIARSLSASEYKNGRCFTEDLRYVYEDGTIEKDPLNVINEYNFNKVAFLFE